MITDKDIKHNSCFVELWDLGPTKPKPPSRPEFKSTHNEGTPDYDIDKAEFEEHVKQYAADLNWYRRMRAEWEHWQHAIGGPMKVDMWPIDARTVLEAQASGRLEVRYVKRLPQGKKPGHYQLEVERRQMHEAEARQRDIDNDPHFGSNPRP